MRQGLFAVFVLLLLPSTAVAAKKSSSLKAANSTTSCLIKGNISSDKEKIYHVVGCSSYNATIIDAKKGERWFCTEQEAKDAGWRKAKNCPK